jgi:hypothetical protein
MSLGKFLLNNPSTVVFSNNDAISKIEFTVYDTHDLGSLRVKKQRIAIALNKNAVGIVI